MAHRDLHGTYQCQPGPTQVISVLLLISKLSQASKEVQSNKYEHDKQDDI